jgi:hypothetical protein
MSRQNKVNPGMYTQRGRLTQDDAAREIARQRAVGSQHTWQPVQRDRMPKFAAGPDHSEQEEAETAKPTKDVKRAASAKRVQARPAPAKSAAKPAVRRAAKAGAKTTLRAKAKTASGARRKTKSAKPGARSAAQRTSVRPRKS